MEMKFYLRLHNFSELRNKFSRVPLGNCLWCYFAQLFVALAFRNCKKDFSILNIILLRDVFQLRIYTKIDI